MLVLTFKPASADQLESMQMAFPYADVEPLLRLLAPAGIPEPGLCARVRSG